MAKDTRFREAVEALIEIHKEQLETEIMLREQLNKALKESIKLSDEVVRLRKELGYE